MRKVPLTLTKPPRVYRSEGIVLRGYDYGEADRILTLYTPHAGKQRAIAKGVRRTKSRMGGHLDLFIRSQFLVARGRQLDIVTQADTIENFAALRDDLRRFSFGQYVAELVDAFTAEQLANYPLYAHVITTFRRLASSSNLEVVVRSFELQLLALTGYRPQLHRCLHCDSLIVPQVNRFSSAMGGVLCPECGAADQAAPAITTNALKMMRNLQTNEAGMLKLPQPPEDVRREVEERLREYITFRMESRPRSVRFLDELRSAGAKS